MKRKKVGGKAAEGLAETPLRSKAGGQAAEGGGAGGAGLSAAEIAATISETGRDFPISESDRFLISAAESPVQEAAGRDGDAELVEASARIAQISGMREEEAILHAAKSGWTDSELAATRKSLGQIRRFKAEQAKLAGRFSQAEMLLQSSLLLDAEEARRAERSGLSRRGRRCRSALSLILLSCIG